jgi:hypothetical protein
MASCCVWLRVPRASGNVRLSQISKGCLYGPKLESAFGGKADIEFKSVTSAFDPKRTLPSVDGYFQPASLTRYDASSEPRAGR